MIDPIADMLTHIRNAIRLKKPDVSLPYSKSKYAIATILQREGWLTNVEKIDDRFPLLRLTLKYEEDGSSTIRELQRVSKPSRRVYVGKDKLPVVLSNFGLAIISTSSGMMTNKEARKKGLGGEIICEVY